MSIADAFARSELARRLAAAHGDPAALLPEPLQGPGRVLTNTARAMPFGPIGIGVAALQNRPDLQGALDREQVVAKALSGALLAGADLALNPARNPTFDAVAAAQGNPIERLAAGNEFAAAQHPRLTGLLNLATDPLNLIGPLGKAAQVAKLGRVATALEGLNIAQRAGVAPAERLAAVAGPELAGKLAGRAPEAIAAAARPVEQAVARKLTEDFSPPEGSLADLIRRGRGPEAFVTPAPVTPTAPAAEGVSIFPPETQARRAAAQVAQDRAARQEAADAAAARPPAWAEREIAQPSPWAERFAEQPRLAALERHYAEHPEQVQPLVDALHAANYPGEGRAAFPLRHITGADYAGDIRATMGEQTPNYLDYLLLRSVERPGVLERLPPELQRAVRSFHDIAPSPLSADELQNMLRAGFDRPAKGAARAAQVAPEASSGARVSEGVPEANAPQGVAGDAYAAFKQGLGEARGAYAPANAAYYARYGVDAGDVPGFLGRAEAEGLIGPAEAGHPFERAAQAPASLADAQAAFDVAATPEAKLAAERRFVDAYQGAGMAAPAEQVAREGAAEGNRGQDLFKRMQQGGPSAAGGYAPIHLATTAGGAVAGGALGYQSDPDAPLPERLALGATGALAGAAAAGTAPTAMPQLASALGRAAGEAFGGGIFTREAQAHALRVAGRAQKAALTQKGAPLGKLPGEFNKQLWNQILGTPHALAQDALNRWAVTADFGRDVGLREGDIRAAFAGIVKNADNPTPFERLPDALQAKLEGLGITDFNPDEELGTSFVASTLGRQPDLNILQRALGGAVMGLGNTKMHLANVATGGVPVAAPLWGAVRGTIGPFLETYLGELNRFQHEAPRVAMFEKHLDANLARGLPIDEARKAAADRAAFLFGDFRHPGAIEMAVSKAFPLSRWSIRQAPVTAEMIARHPGPALTLLSAIKRDADRAQREGGAPWDVGVPTTTEDPLIGAWARARLGGQAGTARLNPLSLLVPGNVGEVMSVPGEVADKQTFYDKATSALGAAGLSPHPLVQGLAYAAGQTSRMPGSLSRTAGLENLTSLIPGMPEAPGLGQALNAARGILAPAVEKAGIPTVGPAGDPIRREAARIYWEQNHKALGSEGTEDGLAQLMDPTSPLMQEAKRRVVLSDAAGNLTSVTAPIGSTATGATQATAARARQGVPFSREQIQGLRDRGDDATADLLDEENATYKGAHPEAAIEDVATSGRAKDALVQHWKDYHGGLYLISPTLYNYELRKFEAALDSLSSGNPPKQIAPPRR